MSGVINTVTLIRNEEDLLSDPDLVERLLDDLDFFLSPWVASIIDMQEEISLDRIFERRAERSNEPRR